MSKLVPKETPDAITRKKGHYKAYGHDGTVMWEQKDFVIGVDQIPSGLADGMKACTVTDGKTLVHRWDPHNMLH